MLLELRVENLLLMERAQLALAPGLNVLTGETGAGKTLLAHALDLLLGGRARAGIVRKGAAEAYVEGVFSLPPSLAGDERITTDADDVVLARRVWPDGRTRAYVCGRAATVADLRELGGGLLAFYGQHEHRKLTVSAAQLEVLDSHCGADADGLLARVGEAHARLRALRSRIEELGAADGGRERELDLLRFELQEIESIGPSEGEETELVLERDRLAHLETLRAAAHGGADAIAPQDGEAGVLECLAEAAAQLEPAAEIDSGLRELSERMQALRFEAEDVGAELRRYADALDGEGHGPGRLEEVGERLAQFSRLERKHGGSLPEVLRHAERCRTRIEELCHVDDDLAAAQAELAPAAQALDELAARLTERRREAAPGLAAAVMARLAELAMPDARFEVQLHERPEGSGARGAETVELRLAPNAGLPAGPLREIASGGELSRVMLALLSVAHGAGGPGDRAEAPLLVFDEIDAGVGGHTARAVGEHLRALAGGRQVLCITHLPQVAALAARHFTIVKDGSRSPARTTVTALDGDQVVGELVRMLGAGESDRAATQHARQLLKAA